MYGVNSMVKDGYWTIKAQEYNDEEEIDEINNRCLTFIPSLPDATTALNKTYDALNKTWDNYNFKRKLKGYV